MNGELDNWQQNNQRYLSAALEWLRLRLLRLAQGSATAAPIDCRSDPEPPSASKWRFWDKPDPNATSPRRLLLPAPTVPLVTDEQLAQAALEMETAEAARPAPAMVVLSQNFELSEFEKNVLLLCAAMEFDPRIAGLCAASIQRKGISAISR